jgi:hypothetical protein
MSGIGLQLSELLDVGAEGAVAFDLDGRSIVASLIVKSIVSVKPPMLGCAFTNLAAVDRDWIARFAQRAHGSTS